MVFFRNLLFSSLWRQMCPSQDGAVICFLGWSVGHDHAWSPWSILIFWNSWAVFRSLQSIEDEVKENSSSSIRTTLRWSRISMDKGGGEVSNPVSAHKRLTSLVYPSGVSMLISRFTFNIKCHDSQSVQGRIPKSNRMASVSSDSSNFGQGDLVTVVRHICANQESQTSSILFQNAGSEGFGSRFPLNLIVRNDSIRFPDNVSLVPKTLQKIVEEDCLILLIAPFWLHQFLFNHRMELIVN